MAIEFSKDKKIFSLHTRHSTYQMQIDRYGFLLHLYYGKRIRGYADYLIVPSDVGFAGNPYEAGTDRTYSLNTLPQEYPSFGVGDYRTGCIGVVNPDGSRAADLRYGSHEIREAAHRITGMPALYDEGGEAQTLEVRMKDAATGLEVVLYYTVFEDKDIIARSVIIKNNGNGRIILERALSACLDLDGKDWELIHFHGRHAMERQFERTPLFHGSMSIGSTRGTSSHQHNPSFILCEPGCTETAGECCGMILTYSSNFTAEIETDQLSQVRAVMGIHPENFQWVLNPGECFETPQVMMAFSDRGLGRLSSVFHTIMNHNLCRGIYKLARRPVLINNWEATYFDFNREKLLAIGKQAAELGIEMLVLDDGWFGKRDDDYSGLGDWFVNEKKTGGSIGSLAEEINAMGLKFGIWMEPEMVSEDSELYRSHPEWALQIPGRKPCRSRSQLVLDLSREDVRDYLFDCMKQLLDSANIEYLKWDMNRSMCDIYSQVLGTERQGEVYHRCMLGIYDLLERLVTAYPRLLIEGCSGGGGRFDPAMLYYSPQIWCSDDTDAIERLEIQYGTSFFYPVSSVGSHVSASPNHQTGRSAPMETRGVVAMAGTFGYELDLNLLTEEEKQIVKRQVEDYKKYAGLISSGQYYRLSSPYDKQGITAWQFVSGDRRQSLVSIVCSHVRANEPAARIRLEGLDPEQNYRLEGSEQIYSGSALMYAGIRGSVMQGDYPALQMYFTVENS